MLHAVIVYCSFHLLHFKCEVRLEHMQGHYTAEESHLISYIIYSSTEKALPESCINLVPGHRCHDIPDIWYVGMLD